MRTKVDRGREGGDLAVSGHPFHCGLCKKKEGM